MKDSLGGNVFLNINVVQNTYDAKCLSIGQ